MSRETTDDGVRTAAFDWLAKRQEILGEPVFDYNELQRGFDLHGIRVNLVGQKGIWKPRLCEWPLSILTKAMRPGAPRPYEDAFEDRQLCYKYRGVNPGHPDNVGLRDAMRLGVPLVYFFGISPGKYMAQWPIFVVGDDPGTLEFRMQLDEQNAVGEGDPGVRAYRTHLMKVRLHQITFREKVLRAYRSQCALCRLRHRGLLDAAHILPDSEGGQPVVVNGLSLCKLHHAAFDKMFLGIRPDHIVEIRRDVLEEEDGPMLLHGLKNLHRKKIVVPHRLQDQPDVQLLTERFQRFQQAPLRS